MMLAPALLQIYAASVPVQVIERPIASRFDPACSRAAGLNPSSLMLAALVGPHAAN